MFEAIQNNFENSSMYNMDLFLMGGSIYISNITENFKLDNNTFQNNNATIGGSLYFAKLINTS